MIGIDEVGRGCWAGPLLVVAARQRSVLPIGIKDSKKLTKRQREQLLDPIRLSCDLGEGWVASEEIDQLGLSAAMRLAVSRALRSLKATNGEEIVIDGNINYCESLYVNSQCVISADDTHPIVSAASICAKLLRDQKMQELAQIYPNYGFEKHVGYGTKQHSEALHLYGVSKIHRKSYKPVKAFL